MHLPYIKTRFRQLEIKNKLFNISKRRESFKKTRVHLGFGNIMAGIFRTGIRRSIFSLSPAGTALFGIGELCLQKVKQGWIYASPVAAAQAASSTNILLATGSFLWLEACMPVASTVSSVGSDIGDFIVYTGDT
jgi:hypothetical protein